MAVVYVAGGHGGVLKHFSQQYLELYIQKQEEQMVVSIRQSV